MVRQQLFIGAALIAGVAIGFFVQPEPVSSETADEATNKPAALIEDQGENAVITALRARIRALEARLVHQDKEDELLVSNAVARLVAEKGPQQRKDPKQWMEELKKKDPARFTQMTNRFAQMMTERKNRQAARAEYLSSVNTSHMSAQARRTHDEYQELLARREALEEKMHNPDLSNDARRGLMEELREVSHKMRTVGNSERQVLLGEIAYEIGLEGDAASELVETIQDVVEATDSNAGRGPHGPPPVDAPPPSNTPPAGGPGL